MEAPVSPDVAWGWMDECGVCSISAGQEEMEAAPYTFLPVLLLGGMMGEACLASAELLETHSLLGEWLGEEQCVWPCGLPSFHACTAHQ